VTTFVSLSTLIRDLRRRSARSSITTLHPREVESLRDVA
jgi:hypothetical protein